MGNRENSFVKQYCIVVKTNGTLYKHMFQMSGSRIRLDFLKLVFLNKRTGSERKLCTSFNWNPFSGFGETMIKQECE